MTQFGNYVLWSIPLALPHVHDPLHHILCGSEGEDKSVTQRVTSYVAGEYRSSPHTHLRGLLLLVIIGVPT